jgi:thiamine-monophosphate kinase
MTDLKKQSLLTVGDLGEQGLLERLQRYCPPEIIGDDGAIVPLATNASLVVTTDVLVDGVHFSDRTTSPEDVGWRAAAANLSDLAAMGASPLGITVGLSLPSTIAVDWVDRLYLGLSDCLSQYNTPIVGGDICRSAQITVAIAAFGQLKYDFVIRRDAAKSGDAIVVTGVHGASRAGLECLLNPEWGKFLSETDKQKLIKAHQRPQPRLDVLSTLAGLPNLERIAGMDSSDGLADAVLQICRRSRVGAELEAGLITLPQALRQFDDPELAMNWALYGGEDFELVLCLPLEQAQALVQLLGANAAIIGSVRAGEKVELCDRNGTYLPQALALNSGFQHFIN